MRLLESVRAERDRALAEVAALTAAARGAEVEGESAAFQRSFLESQLAEVSCLSRVRFSSLSLSLSHSPWLSRALSLPRSRSLSLTLALSLALALSNTNTLYYSCAVSI